MHGTCAASGDRFASGHAVAGGRRAGHRRARAGCGFRSSADADIAVPAFVRPEYAPGWLTLTRDPAPAAGPAAPTAHGRRGRRRPGRRRGRSFAAVQEQYYRQPAADRARLARVPAGRSTAAATSTWSTTSRPSATATRSWPTRSRGSGAGSTPTRGSTTAPWWSSRERLAATLPDPLDTVFLVNSGSEAVDLALRLAMATTGRQDVVAVRGGLPRLDLCHRRDLDVGGRQPQRADHPPGLGAHRALPQQLPRRAPRRPDAARYAPEAVAIIEDLAAQGHPPAAFICEPFYGNAGGIALPDGYLDAVYAAVRAAGGLAIADEVQVGYGRLGRWFWGFQRPGRGARYRHRRQGDGQRPTAGRGDHHPSDRRGLPHPGLLLLLGRRQPGLLRRRPDGARRHRTGRVCSTTR